MRGGRHVSAGGMNDFEIRLLGTSIVGAVAPKLAADRSVPTHRPFRGVAGPHGHEPGQARVRPRARPHPPFLYAGGVSDCWPGCDIFDVNADKLEMSEAEWADRMGQTWLR